MGCYLGCLSRSNKIKWAIAVLLALLALAFIVACAVTSYPCQNNAEDLRDEGGTTSPGALAACQVDEIPDTYHLMTSLLRVMRVTQLIEQALQAHHSCVCTTCSASSPAWSCKQTLSHMSECLTEHSVPLQSGVASFACDAASTRLLRPS